MPAVHGSVGLWQRQKMLVPKVRIRHQSSKGIACLPGCQDPCNGCQNDFAGQLITAPANDWMRPYYCGILVVLLRSQQGGFRSAFSFEYPTLGPPCLGMLCYPATGDHMLRL